jgi:hypothetical protein
MMSDSSRQENGALQPSRRSELENTWLSELGDDLRARLQAEYLSTAATMTTILGHNSNRRRAVIGRFLSTNPQPSSLGWASSTKPHWYFAGNQLRALRLSI